jgi:hypothetical protein
VAEAECNRETTRGNIYTAAHIPTAETILKLPQQPNPQQVHMISDVRFSSPKAPRIVYPFL